MRKKALNTEEREILVINWFAIRLQHDNDNSASLSEIARGLGMSPSSHLRAILDGMVSKGMLDKTELIRPGRWMGWGYNLKKGTFQRPPRKAITLNYSRHGERQLELL
jgi:hypothetical protein